MWCFFTSMKKASFSPYSGKHHIKKMKWQIQEREHCFMSGEGLKESFGGGSEGEWVYFPEFM